MPHRPARSASLHSGGREGHSPFLAILMEFLGFLTRRMGGDENCIMNFLQSPGLALHRRPSPQSALILKARHGAAQSLLPDPSCLLPGLPVPLGQNHIVGVCLGDICHRVTAPGSRFPGCDMMTVYFTPFSFPAGIRRFKDTEDVFSNL